MRDAEFIRAVGIGAADHLDHQPHERRVLEAEVASADSFKAAVLINHGLDVLHGRLWGGGGDHHSKSGRSEKVSPSASRRA